MDKENTAAENLRQCGRWIKDGVKSFFNWLFTLILIITAALVIAWSAYVASNTTCIEPPADMPIACVFNDHGNWFGWILEQ